MHIIALQQRHFPFPVASILYATPPSLSPGLPVLPPPAALPTPKTERLCRYLYGIFEAKSQPLE
jgi:hypothetical protein